ncbi:ABC transporter permease [Virgibacillus sp. NKC19-16]|uniref:ABC transporter permease n=1 Tax=Virgibacillus salidurans TaxID=2831673 RepID=UPI001F219414|nr:ABC transporter permease [Virgibacillus sp. NKC19-16]UJL46184.1 ABC transporter permease [Virgibacillus sp. NKC19-16]
MHNTTKVAKWEIKRNMKNKSYLIGLFLTPAIFLFFFMMPSIFGGSDEEEAASTTVFVNDQLGVYEQMEQTAEQSGFDWELQQTDVEESDVNAALEDEENTAYVFVDESSLENGVVPVYTSNEMDQFFTNQVQALAAPIQAMKLEELGLSDEEMAVVSSGVVFEETTAGDMEASESGESTDTGMAADNLMERIVPGAFAMAIMLSIVLTGMAIFQSASQEKKDKIAEIILSSLTPGELMQGKIVGYFVLGLIQVVVLTVFILPVLVWQIDVPILEYLFVPELLLLIAIAILGYLLFASIFVGIGATMSDVSTAGNFQGMVMMLPFLPAIFIGPVISDPSGFVAQLGTYIPFTSPGVLLLRLSLLEEWPWMEILIAIAILVVSVWVFMKLAGKIFKTGILMYGKNATPGEIWKWIRA